MKRACHCTSFSGGILRCRVLHFDSLLSAAAGFVVVVAAAAVVVVVVADVVCIGRCSCPLSIA